MYVCMYVAASCCVLLTYDDECLVGFVLLCCLFACWFALRLAVQDGMADNNAREFFRRRTYHTCLLHHPHLLIVADDHHIGRVRATDHMDEVQTPAPVVTGAAGPSSAAGYLSAPGSVNNLNNHGTIDWVAQLLRFAYSLVRSSASTPSLRPPVVSTLCTDMCAWPGRMALALVPVTRQPSSRHPVPSAVDAACVRGRFGVGEDIAQTVGGTRHQQHARERHRRRRRSALAPLKQSVDLQTLERAAAAASARNELRLRSALVAVCVDTFQLHGAMERSTQLSWVKPAMDIVEAPATGEAAASSDPNSNSTTTATATTSSLPVAGHNNTSRDKVGISAPSTSSSFSSSSSSSSSSSFCDDDCSSTSVPLVDAEGGVAFLENAQGTCRTRMHARQIHPVVKLFTTGRSFHFGTHRGSIYDEATSVLASSAAAVMPHPNASAMTNSRSNTAASAEQKAASSPPPHRGKSVGGGATSASAGRSAAPRLESVLTTGGTCVVGWLIG